MSNEKLVHLKDEKGKSFSVTPHAFENIIKKDKNWRSKYDLVGEIDAESHAHKSESAMPYVKGGAPAVVAETKKEIVDNGTKEASTKEVFTSDDKNEFINLDNKDNETQKQTSIESDGKGKGNNANTGSKKGSGNKS